MGTSEIRWYILIMVQLAGAEREIIDRYRHALRDRFPQAISEMILFGSRVRGEGHPDSDLDLLVVLNTQDPDLKREVLDLAWETMLSLDFKVFISPIVFFKKDYDRYRSWNSSFLENISRDAVRL